MQSERVAETSLTQLAERCPFAIRTHNRAAPKVRIVNILIFRCDVEIAANDQLGSSFARQTLSQPCVPIYFVIIGGRTDCPPVRRVNREDPDTVDCCFDNPCLWIDNPLTTRPPPTTPSAFPHPAT